MAIMKGYGVIEPTVSWGWMEKQIGEHHKNQPAPIAFKEFHK